jgi:hypothetical protein
VDYSGAGLAIKKTHPKNPPKKTHLKKPTKNVFFWVFWGFLNFFIFMKIIQTFLFETDFYEKNTTKTIIYYNKIVRYAHN